MDPPWSCTDEWDGHLLLLYDSELERVAGVAAWVRRGLERGDKIVYTETPRAGRPSMMTLLQRHGVDSTQAIAERRLLLLPLERFYPAQGQEQIVDAALAEGFASVRLSSESTAALTMLPAVEYAAIERTMDRLCRTRPISALCQYPRPLSVGSHLDKAVEIHLHGIRQSLLRSWAISHGTAVGGEVDASNAEVFASLVTAAVQVGQDVACLDLTQLRFLDAAGAAALVERSAAFRSEGGRVLLVSPAPRVARVLCLLGIDEEPGMMIAEGAR